MLPTSRQRMASRKPSTARSSLTKQDVAQFAAALQVELSDWQLTMITHVLKATDPITVARRVSGACSARLAMSSSAACAMTPGVSTEGPSTYVPRHSMIYDELKDWTPLD